MSDVISCDGLVIFASVVAMISGFTTTLPVELPDNRCPPASFYRRSPLDCKVVPLICLLRTLGAGAFALSLDPLLVAPEVLTATPIFNTV